LQLGINLFNNLVAQFVGSTAGPPGDERTAR
jgi:hypothetical protein